MELILSNDIVFLRVHEFHERREKRLVRLSVRHFEGQHLQTVHDLANDRRDIDLFIGTQVRVELDVRELQEVVDQPRHPGRL